MKRELTKMEMHSKLLEGKRKQLKDITMEISIKVPLIVFVLFLAGGDDKLTFEKQKRKARLARKTLTK